VNQAEESKTIDYTREQEKIHHFKRRRGSRLWQGLKGPAFRESVKEGFSSGYSDGRPVSQGREQREKKGQGPGRKIQAGERVILV